MKNKSLSFIIILSLAIAGGCKKDNREAPTATITGKVVYQGQAIGVRTPTAANGTISSGVQLELWQHGYQLFTKLAVYIEQDGSYSASVFDGDYKLVRLKGTGPWVDATDSIDVHVSGNTVVDVPVEPYYFIKTSSAAKSGTNLTATCTLQRVNTTKTLEAVRIYVSTTNFVDQSNNFGSASILAAAIPDPTQPINLTLAIPASVATKDYVYVRVGVKTTGITELAYGTPFKIALK